MRKFIRENTQSSLKWSFLAFSAEARIKMSAAFYVEVFS